MTSHDYAVEAKIIGVDAARCTFVLHHPIRFGAAVYTTRDYVLVRIRTDAGVDGFAAGLTRDTPVLEALRPVAQQLLGADVGSAQTMVRSLRRRNVPGQPALVRAHSLADLGLWDVLSRLGNVSLARLLGGPERSSVGVTAVSGYLIDVRGDDAIVDEVRELVHQGFKHIKLMLGAQDQVRMHALLSRCRSVTEGRALLSLDLHFSLDTLDEALRLCKPLDELGLAFIEDPFAPLHWRDLRSLAEQIGTPLAAGEDVTDPVSYIDLLEGVSLLRVDPHTCGGVDDAIAGIELAAEAGRPVMPHGSPWVGSQLAAVRESIEWVEVAAPLDTGDRFMELCQGSSLTITDGELTIDDGPGVDVALDWDRLDKLDGDRWTV